MTSLSARFLNHTQRGATVGRTALDEWSARRRDIYLSTHNRQTSMPPVGFEPTIDFSLMIQVNKGCTIWKANSLSYFRFYAFQRYQKFHKQFVIIADAENVLPQPLQRTVAPQLIFDILCTKNRFWRMQRILKLCWWGFSTQYPTVLTINFSSEVEQCVVRKNKTRDTRTPTCKEKSCYRLLNYGTRIWLIYSNLHLW
jgi:hypothetical protein